MEAEALVVVVSVEADRVAPGNTKIMIFKELGCIVLLMLLLACGSSKNVSTKNNDGILTYVLTPNLKGSQAFVQVEFQAKADANGKIQLGYPNSDWGEENLFACINEFKVSPSVKSDFRKDKNQIYIWGEPNKTYSFSYKVVQDFSELPKNENTYRPIINKDYFHIIGKNLLMLPFGYFGSEETRCYVHLKWKYPRKRFEVVNSFGNQKEQTIDASYHEIYSSIFIGGKIQSSNFEINENRIVFATTDEWENIDVEKAALDLSKIIRQQREFWNDHSTKLQTVTLIKTFEDCPNKNACSNSLSGTALTNSFAAFCSDNWLSSNNRMNWLFAHELFHNWVGNKIQNESEEKEYWFSEGFTDYYAYKLLLRNGMMSLDEFIQKVNEEIIEPHYNASNNNSPNSEITADKFWADRLWEKLPYRRGWLYAFQLDCKIKNHGSNSLDDVMLEILRITQTEKVSFNQDIFFRAVEKYLDIDFQDDFYQFIENGKPIRLNEINAIGLYFESTGTPFMRKGVDISVSEMTNFLQR